MLPSQEGSVLRAVRFVFLAMAASAFLVAGCGGGDDAVPIADDGTPDLSGVLVDVHHDPG